MTFHRISSSLARSIVAPAPTSSSSPAPVPTATSQCTRFLTVFGSGTGTKLHPSNGSPGTSSSHQPLSSSPPSVAPNTSAQNRATGCGSVQSTTTSYSRYAGRLAGSRTNTQNSPPSGSAMTVQPRPYSSAGSSTFAPSRAHASTDSAWTSRC